MLHHWFVGAKNLEPEKPICSQRWQDINIRRCNFCNRSRRYKRDFNDKVHPDEQLYTMMEIIYFILFIFI